MSRRRIKKGKFKPKNPEKYKGDPTNIVYRSGLEKKVMEYFDTNPGVIAWQSEEKIIPYFDEVTKRQRRYFPDFWIKTKDGTETLIEVKPYSQTIPPKCTDMNDGRKFKRYQRELATYSTNTSKWDAAKAVCAKNGWKWTILTEKEIQPRYFKRNAQAAVKRKAPAKKRKPSTTTKKTLKG